MSIKPLHHVVLSASDFERSVAFYEEAFGWRKTLESEVEGYERYLHLPDGTSGRMAMLAADERTLGMVEVVWFDLPEAEASPPKRMGDPGVVMIALEVEDETLEEIAARWGEQGIELYSPITAVELEGYPSFQTLLVEDPDGLLIELIQLPTQDEVRAFRAALREKQAAAAE